MMIDKQSLYPTNNTVYFIPSTYRGAVIALVLSNIAPPFIVIVYVWARKVHKLTWKGFSWHNLDEWIPFLKLAIPGMLMNCLEWWGAEVITFISGGISKTELAATSVWFQIMVILYMVRTFLCKCAVMNVVQPCVHLLLVIN